MLFPSVIFIFIFLPIALTVIVPFTVKGRYYNIKLANFLLLIFSLVFYMYGEVKFTYIMLGSGGINFICAKLCAPSQNKYRKYYFFAGITGFSFEKLRIQTIHSKRYRLLKQTQGKSVYLRVLYSDDFLFSCLYPYYNYKNYNTLPIVYQYNIYSI